MALGYPTAVTDALEIDSGPLRGIEHGELRAYLGIPYAAPPVGKLRWMPPQPPKAWTAIRECNQFGNDCLQDAYLGVFARAGGDEDCLYLNVFVGKKAAQSSKSLPVLVWIHGGAAQVGSGRHYDASKLALAGNAVVVTFNYRLGVFGFFAHPGIDREGHPFGNYGLMDQQLVLDWVQRNIGAFNGDPGNVTVFGESTGGNSTYAHVVSPLSKNTFQHAISMSGGAIGLKWPIFGALVPLEHAEKVGADFAEAVGCDKQGTKGLRQLPAARILAMQRPYMFRRFMVDGTVIPVPPAEAFRSGNFNRVTVVNGSTADEGTFFAGFPENETGIPMDESGYMSALTMFFGDLAASVGNEYAVEDYSSPSEAYAAVVTDFLFACPGRMIMRWIADKTPTYGYEFADRTAPSYLEPTTFPLGAAHTYELPYLFPGFHGGAGIPVKLNPLQEKLSDKMVEYWTTVAQAGARESEWPKYNPAEDNFLTLALPEPRMTSGRFNRMHRCDFWQKLGIY